MKFFNCLESVIFLNTFLLLSFLFIQCTSLNFGNQCSSNLIDDYNEVEVYLFQQTGQIVSKPQSILSFTYRCPSQQPNGNFVTFGLYRQNSTNPDCWILEIVLEMELVCLGIDVVKDYINQPFIPVGTYSFVVDFFHENNTYITSDFYVESVDQNSFALPGSTPIFHPDFPETFNISLLNEIGTSYHPCAYFRSVDYTGPKANFSWSPTTIKEGTEILFSSTVEGGTNPYSYDWEIRKKNTLIVVASLNGNSPKIILDENGEYTVYLTVTDNYDILDSISDDLTVLDSGPEAQFTWKPTYQEISLPVRFIDLSTFVNDQIILWEWKMGTRSVGSNQQNPNATFQNTGIKQVSLKVTDNDGSSDFIEYNVTILGIPINFFDLSTTIISTIIEWRWFFEGEEFFINSQNPTFTYYSPGEKTITLSVFDDYNRTDYVEKQIIIIEDGNDSEDTEDDSNGTNNNPVLNTTLLIVILSVGIPIFLFVFVIVVFVSVVAGVYITIHRKKKRKEAEKSDIRLENVDTKFL